jgi:hypothetical protein
VGCNADACVTAPFPDDIIALEIPFGWNFNTAVQQLQNGVRDLTSAVWHWASAPRNPGCVATLTTAGAAGGAALGAKAGFIGGAGIGGLGGTAIEPGGGTLVGGWAGGVEGAAGGAIAGGTLGAIGGKAAGYALCATSGGGGGGGGRKWKLGNNKSDTKWRNQLAKRGWTPEQIDQAIENGQQYPAPNNINPANGATRFVNPATGRSVVVDNVTGEVLHVGGDGFRY